MAGTKAVGSGRENKVDALRCGSIRAAGDPAQAAPGNEVSLYGIGERGDRKGRIAEVCMTVARLRAGQSGQKVMKVRIVGAHREAQAVRLGSCK